MLSKIIKYWFNTNNLGMRDLFLSFRNIHLSMNERFLKENQNIKNIFKKYEINFKQSNWNEIICLFKILYTLKIEKINYLEMDKVNGVSSIDFIANNEIKLEITSAVLDLNKKSYKDFISQYLKNKKNIKLFEYEKLIWDLQSKIIDVLNKKIRKEYIDKKTVIAIWHTPFLDDIPFPGYAFLYLVLFNKLNFFLSILEKIDGIYFFTYYNNNNFFKNLKTQDGYDFNIPKLNNWQYSDIIIKITKKDLPLSIETFDGWIMRVYTKFIFLNIK